MKPEDFQSAAWKRFKRDLEARLAELRAQNDKLTNDENTTTAIRGRIAEVKRILSLEPSESEAQHPDE